MASGKWKKNSDDNWGNDKVFQAKVGNGKQFIAKDKSWLDYYYEDQDRRAKEAEQGKVRYTEAAKASRVQYSLPGYQGKSQNQGKTYNWERDLMQNTKIKGAGNSYTKKFDALTKSMGMTPGQAEEYRKFMDFQEDSQHVDPKMNKDGKINQTQSLNYARDAHLQTDVLDGILNQMTERTKELAEKARQVKFEKVSGFDKLKNKLGIDKYSDEQKNTIQAGKLGVEPHYGGKKDKTDPVYKDRWADLIATKKREDAEKAKGQPKTEAPANQLTGYETPNAAGLDPYGNVQNPPTQNDKYVQANAVLSGEKSLHDSRSALDKIMDVLNAPLKAIDKNVLRPAERFAVNFTDGMVGQQLKKNEDKFDESMTPEFVRQASEEPTNGGEKAIDVIGELAGMTAPVGAGYKIASPIAKAVASTKYGQAAVRGGAAMGLYSGAQQGVDELTNPEDGNFTTRAQNVALNAGLGALGDPALLLAGAGLKAGASNVLGRMAKVDGEIPTYSGQVSDSILDRLAPNQAGTNQDSGSLYESLIRKANPGVKEAGEAITQAQAQKQAAEDAFVRQQMFEPKGPNPNFISGNPALEANIREQFNRTPQASQLDDLIAQLTGQRESALNAPSSQPPKINDWQSKVQEPAPVSMEGITPRTDVPINNWQDNIVKNSQAVEQATAPADAELETIVNNVLEEAQVTNQAPEQVIDTLVQTVAKEAPEKLDELFMSLDGKIKPPKAETEVVNPAPASEETKAGSDLLVPLNLQQHSTPSEISWVADTPGPLDGVTKKTVAQAAKTQVTSDLQFVKDMMRDIADQDMGATLSMMGKKGKDVAFEDNLFKGLRSVRRSISEAMKASKEDYGTLMKDLKKNGISKRDFDEYVSAVHFQDVLTNNAAKSQREGEVAQLLEEIEFKMEHTTVKKEIKALEAEEKKLLKEKDALEPYKLPREATPIAIAKVLDKWQGNATMESAQKVFMEAQRKDLQMQVESGLISQSAAEAMVKAHPNYIYMGRAKEGGSTFGASGNISKAKQHIKKRGEGSGDQLKLTPLDSAVRNRVLTYHNVSRNNAMKTIEKLAVANGGDQYFAKLNPRAASNTDKMNTVKFFKDGKAELYEVPPVLKQAFESLDEKAAKNLADSTIRAASNMIRKGGTYYNLDFIFTSPARETNALITSRTGLHPGQLVLGYMDSFFGKGLEKASGGKFKSYRESYEKMGGHQTGIVTQDPQSLKAFTKAMNKGGWGKGFEMINPLEWISKVGGLVEHGPKLGEFRSAKGKGYSDKDAMHEAVDVIDYTDLGKTTRTVNRYVPFAGPMVRGTTRYFQAAKENPKAWLGKNLMYVTAPTVGIYAMRFAPWATDEQRSKIRNMTEWQKNLTWSIPAPDGKTIWSVPKMHVGAQLFANPVERILDQMYDQDPKSVPRLLKDTGKDLGGVLTPPNSIAGLQLIMDSMANYNRLMDMPIEDLTMKSSDKTTHYNMYTSEAAKGLGKLTNQSPAKIDYLLKGLTAGTGRDALDLSDNILASLGVDRPKKIDTNLDILNPVRRYQYKDTSGTGTSNRLYEQQKRDEEAGNGDSEAVRLYADMKALNKEIKGIRESKDMSSQEKKEAIAELRAQQRTIGDEAIKLGILKNR